MDILIVDDEVSSADINSYLSKINTFFDKHVGSTSHDPLDELGGLMSGEEFYLAMVDLTSQINTTFNEVLERYKDSPFNIILDIKQEIDKKIFTTPNSVQTNLKSSFKTSSLTKEQKRLLKQNSQGTSYGAMAPVLFGAKEK